MKITFVRPSLFGRRSFDAMQPLCFAILKALTPDDVETALYDERLEAIPLDEPTDLVALSVETYTAKRSYQIAAAYRRRGVKVVMGGYHPTLMPDEASRFADAVVIGDAEGTWPGLVADARAARLRSAYRPIAHAARMQVRPDRSIFAGKRYAPVTLVQYGRGCRYNCEFCSIRAFYGSELRQRAVREVVDEIERGGRRHVFIVDDNVFVDVPKAKALFSALVPLGISWSCQISIDIVKDRELIALMQRSGCTTAVVGFESLRAANLKQMRKAWNAKHGRYCESLEVLRDAGIMVYGSFVFGYDADTVDSFDEALEFAIENKLYLANFNPLTPMPGTPLLERLRREERLLHEAWWLAADYRYGAAAFRPRGMSADELTAGCYRARTRFNTCGSILTRALSPRTSMRSMSRLGLYFLSNIVSRREIHDKQGRALGAPDLEARLPAATVASAGGGAAP